MMETLQGGAGLVLHLAKQHGFGNEDPRDAKLTTKGARLVNPEPGAEQPSKEKEEIQVHLFNRLEKREVDPVHERLITKVVEHLSSEEKFGKTTFTAALLAAAKKEYGMTYAEFTADLKVRQELERRELQIESVKDGLRAHGVKEEDLDEDPAVVTLKERVHPLEEAKAAGEFRATDPESGGASSKLIIKREKDLALEAKRGGKRVGHLTTALIPEARRIKTDDARRQLPDAWRIAEHIMGEDFFKERQEFIDEATTYLDDFGQHLTERWPLGDPLAATRTPNGPHRNGDAIGGYHGPEGGPETDPNQPWPRSVVPGDANRHETFGDRTPAEIEAELVEGLESMMSYFEKYSTIDPEIAAVAGRLQLESLRLKERQARAGTIEATWTADGGLKSTDMYGEEVIDYHDSRERLENGKWVRRDLAGNIYQPPEAATLTVPPESQEHVPLARLQHNYEEAYARWEATRSEADLPAAWEAGMLLRRRLATDRQAPQERLRTLDGMLEELRPQQDRLRHNLEALERDPDNPDVLDAVARIAPSFRSFISVNTEVHNAQYLVASAAEAVTHHDGARAREILGQVRQRAAANDAAIQRVMDTSGITDEAELVRRFPMLGGRLRLRQSFQRVMELNTSYIQGELDSGDDARVRVAARHVQGALNNTGRRLAVTRRANRHEAINHARGTIDRKMNDLDTEAQPLRERVREILTDENPVNATIARMEVDHVVEGTEVLEPREQRAEHRRRGLGRLALGRRKKTTPETPPRRHRARMEEDGDITWRAVDVNGHRANWTITYGVGDGASRTGRARRFRQVENQRGRFDHTDEYDVNGELLDETLYGVHPNELVIDDNGRVRTS
jgi:hypothetical protein